MHCRGKWQPTPVFLPGESQGRRSLVGCRLWGRAGSDTTEATWRRRRYLGWRSPKLLCSSPWISRVQCKHQRRASHKSWFKKRVLGRLPVGSVDGGAPRVAGRSASLPPAAASRDTGRPPLRAGRAGPRSRDRCRRRAGPPLRRRSARRAGEGGAPTGSGPGRARALPRPLEPLTGLCGFGVPSAQLPRSEPVFHPRVPVPGQGREAPP